MTRAQVIAPANSRVIIHQLLSQILLAPLKKKNIQKRKARPKRSISKPGEDHELGLWIDYDLLRRHQKQTPETILHNPLPSVNNRYLELADIVLGNAKPKKKSKGAAGG